MDERKRAQSAGNGRKQPVQKRRQNGNGRPPVNQTRNRTGARRSSRARRRRRNRRVGIFLFVCILLLAAAVLLSCTLPTLAEEDISQQELLNLVESLNQDDSVNGILVQLPLPKHIDEDVVIQTISPKKDVDGFHPVSVGNLWIGDKGFVSCTPAGIIQLLKRSGIKNKRKNCVVVGRSNIVGKPMACLMLRENATVTVTHSHTQNLKEITSKADILIVAIGKREFITADYVKEGAVVIDVGMHRNEENKLCGDVNFKEVEPKASAITPVPGGVGPMTIAMLMNNCMDAVR